MVRVNQVKLSQTGGVVKSTRKASKNRPQKLRKSLSAGTVVIPLTGPFRGKRVVMLGAIKKSGLLLVTGPFKLNGVPLRRINARYVIATSTKLNLGAMKLDKYDDAYFKAPASSKAKGEDGFFATKAKTETSEARKAEQALIDKTVMAAIPKGEEALYKKYLTSTFALSNNDMPHKMKF